MICNRRYPRKDHEHLLYNKTHSRNAEPTEKFISPRASIEEEARVIPVLTQVLNEPLDTLISERLKIELRVRETRKCSDG